MISDRPETVIIKKNDMFGFEISKRNGQNER